MIISHSCICSVRVKWVYLFGSATNVLLFTGLKVAFLCNIEHHNKSRPSQVEFRGYHVKCGAGALHCCSVVGKNHDCVY